MARITDRLPRPADPVRTTAVTLLVVAALCAAWFGWSWYGAAHDDGLAYSRTREEVVRAGEQAVQNMNTLDYRDIDAGLRVWQESSTGELNRQITGGRAAFADQVRKARTVTTAKVLESALTELDTRTGKAVIMVAVQVTVTPPEGRATTKQSRMLGELTRTGTGWKLSALQHATVGDTGGTPAQ
ncbi:nuclear transport factor 2 family protein [Thermomonospora cellulosilytica]|uniref:Mce-associated membrane protein n=1 Tax=Thermomonospora cellulosilytica TaxID=1411118 RepID=A0A7W3R916_9ACTN|nr:nuclear transport factor 2 family protein [Thermomonospora cellulosilytica]MBA9004321.1 Mce-associated membrane protein [Thermomonospora cellulosilytica]